MSGTPKTAPSYARSGRLSPGATTPRNSRSGPRSKRLSCVTMENRHFRLGLAGFGNVGRALARLLVARRDELAGRCGLTFEVTLLASARRGVRVDSAGIDLERALRDGWSEPSRL